MEHFTRTDWLDLGQGEDGLNWERDPVKHRQTSKKLAPAFSVKSMKAKEPTLHKYIDYFVEKMRQLGGGEDGVELRTVRLPFARTDHLTDSYSDIPSGRIGSQWTFLRIWHIVVRCIRWKKVRMSQLPSS